MLNSLARHIRRLAETAGEPLMKKIWPYYIAAFLSAFLLFQIQPMTSKALLPGFGGSYLVWGACMVFYQGMLLAGYLYAHVIQRLLGVSRYAKAHWILLLLPLLFCPFDFDRLGRSIQDMPLVLAVFCLLFLTVSLPFLTLSTTSLILQRWLSVSELSQRKNPYVLYSASNLGSMLALLTYPTIVEPTSSLELQGYVWWSMYLVFVLLHFFCSPARAETEKGRNGATRNCESGHREISETKSQIPQSGTSRKPAPPRRGRKSQILPCFLLSTAACAMLLATTNVITFDIASVPFLWVLPLCTYLLSFILSFKQRPWYPKQSKNFLYWAIVLGVILHLMTQLRMTLPVWLLIALHLIILFVVCLNCTGSLILAKPDNPYHLTTFYLVLALGGLTGSIIVTWIIPLISTSLIEYPVAFTLTAIAIALNERHETVVWGQRLEFSHSPLGELKSQRPDPASSGASPEFTPPEAGKRYYQTVACLLLVAVSLTALPWAVTRLFDASDQKANIAFALTAVPVVLVMRRMAGRPWQYAAVLLVITISMNWTEDLAVGATRIKRLRNFYGIYKVYDKENLRYLQHGTTQHGRQYTSGPKTTTPLAYFHPETPAAGVLSSPKFHFHNIGMIGMGTGALACYARKDQAFTIYELDPDNLPIAENNFTYLNIARKNGADLKFIFGDGRVSLREEDADSLDLLIIDAFNSGSIPVHLLTVEAFEEYFRVLRPDGLLILHVSNKVLNLIPVVYSNAQVLGVGACEKSNEGNMHPDAELTFWMALSFNHDIIDKLVQDMGWWQCKTESARLPRPWTDKYSNIFGAMFH